MDKAIIVWESRIAFNKLQKSNQKEADKNTDKAEKNWKIEWNLVE